ncbi:MAG: hypothetical protein QN162_15175 [Armatimonadota bacterium]|nr:hypothetical protein [Armatimonadota bacterium]
MPAIKDLRIYQMGRETTRGTAVAATTRWIGELEVTPQEPVIVPAAQLGILVEHPTTDAIATRHAELRLSADLTYEQILHVLNMGLQGVTSGSGAGADKTWTFAPTYTGDPALNSFTFQRRLTDGTTNWDERVAYVLATEWTVSAAVGENAKVEVSAVGRPVETGQAITPSIPVPAVNFVPASAFKVYVNDTLATIGTTQLSGTVVSFRLTYQSPVVVKYYLDARTDKSFTAVALRRAAWTCELQVEWTAAVEAERTKAASRSIRYVRLEAVGPALGASNYKVTFDFPAVHEAGQFDQAGDRDGADTATLRLRDIYDSANSFGLKAVVVNALATLP